MHGGTNPGPPKGNLNAWKYGGYSRAILPAERELYNLIKVGDLDEEIRICKLLLVRTAEAQKNFEQANEFRAAKGIEIADCDIDQIEGLMDEKVCKKYETLMTLANRLSGRIGDLEAVRAKLLQPGVMIPAQGVVDMNFICEKVEKVKHKKRRSS